MSDPDPDARPDPATQPATGRTGRARRCTARLALVPVAAILVGAVLVPTQATTTSSAHRSSARSAPIHQAATALVAYTDCTAMLTDLRSHTAQSTGPYGIGADNRAVFAEGLAAPAAGGASVQANVAASAPTTPAPAFSTTTVQESGVDEPDLVKSDGRRIVSVSGGVLRVIDVASRRVTGMLALPGATAGAGGSDDLFVSGNTALVLARTDPLNGGGGAAYPAGVGAYYPASAGSSASTYYTVDLSGAPRILSTLQPHGGYVDARMVGSTVRLVVRTAPNISLPNTSSNALTQSQLVARNRAAVERAPLTAWLPTYDIVTAAGTSTLAVPCQRVSHPSAFTGTSVLTVYSIDLAKPSSDLSPVSLAADGDTIYAAAGNLFIASTPTTYCCPVGAPIAAGAPLLGNAPARSLDQAGSLPAPSGDAQTTQIHRFDISTPGTPTYLGSGSVPGQLLNSYSMSYYGGHLRVVTTSYTPSSTHEASAVYVLDPTSLRVISQVGGLGNGERVYAVRFAGPLGYVVTYRQVDPLYVIDLADPSNPRLAGQLSLTGYSSYLQAIGNGRLLGVGEEANPQGIAAGLQMSVFDVSDAAAPRLLARLVRPSSRGEGSLDPHAFLYWAATGLAVIPVQSWDPADPAYGAVLAVHVEASRLSTIGLITHPAGASAPAVDGRGQAIERTLVIGDGIWTMSAAGFKVSDLRTATSQAWIPFG